MHHELPRFLKTAFIQQQINAFAGGELSFFVLCFLTDSTAAQQGFFIFGLQQVKLVMVFFQGSEIL